MKKTICLLLLVVAVLMLGACNGEVSPLSTAESEALPPTPQALESTPEPQSTSEPMETFSSDELGFCFSYPQGYTPLPESETVEIVAPALPDTDGAGIFWLEISGAYDRSAEVIANQDLTTATGVDVAVWDLTVGGDPAVALDGMPGQDFQRRVYVVHGQTLYVLAFMPIRSENADVSEQMEALYTAVINSWAWSPCPAGQ